MDDISITSLGTELTPGGAFDTCVAAILGPVKDGSGVVRAFYHAEDFCNYSINQTNKSMAYAQSTDNGRTFTKPGYPENQILIGTTAPTPGAQTGAGDASILDWHGYYYMYFIDWTNLPGTGVARVGISTGGQPGSWYTLFQGAFNSPSIDRGFADHLANMTGGQGGAVSHYTPGDQLMFTHWDPGFQGIGMLFSADGTTWNTSLTEPLIRLINYDWGAQPFSTTLSGSHELHAYVSIQAPTGGSHWSSAFYLTTSYVPPGSDMGTRYMVSRRVDVVMAAQPVSPHVKVALTRYYSPSRRTHWVTTAAPTSDFQVSHLNDYKPEFEVGYTYTKNQGGMNELYDCYIPQWDKFMVGPGICATGNYVLRSLGFIYAIEKPNTVPLYRCWYAAENDHWVSNQRCEVGTTGVVTEFILGYAPM
jgi:hypothetical protein